MYDYYFSKSKNHPLQRIVLNVIDVFLLHLKDVLFLLIIFFLKYQYSVCVAPVVVHLIHFYLQVV